MRPGLLLPLILFLFATGAAHAAFVDTGFRPDPDGFGFPNAGDPEEFGGIDLNALTGWSFHDEILRHTGHCFGMCLASVENFGQNKSSIDDSLADAMPGIDRIQTEQSFYYIGSCFQPPFIKGPDNKAEYEKILERLTSGRPAVLGLYSSGRTHPGHAVVAYMIEQRDGMAYIYVYDPNLPATLHDYNVDPMVAVFDPASNTFSYDNGRQFDEVRLDDIDAAGVAGGQAVTAGLFALPGLAVALIIGRPRYLRRP